MRTGFEGYFRPREDEFAELWEHGLIVLDTNVLLDLYRLPLAASFDLLSILERNAGRIWLPHQVALEFHRGRIPAIAAERTVFRELREGLAAVRESMRQLTRRQQVPADKKASDDELNSAFKSAEAWLSKQAKKHPPELKDLRSMSEDTILVRLVRLYEGRVGPEPDDADLTKIHATAKTRYEKEIPPGYRDAKKDGSRGFGDFILWEQTLRHAETVKKGVILVTSDQKEDWWVSSEGKIVGPRPELIHEFAERTGKNVYLYSRSEFARRGSAKPSTVEEVTGLEQRDAEAQREEGRRMLELRDALAQAHAAGAGATTYATGGGGLSQEALARLGQRISIDPAVLARVSQGFTIDPAMLARVRSLTEAARQPSSPPPIPPPPSEPPPIPPPPRKPPRPPKPPPPRRSK